MTVHVTPRRLESYLAGRWQAGSGSPRELRDAATGAPVALIGADGLDLAGALDHARRVGGPALRAMTFRQRAAMLKGLASALNERREAFYAESYHTGATLPDSRIDIDGGIGTLFAYASRGRRELPDAHHLVEGPVEALSKDATFSATHILTPLQGVAVHINAFNFPVWGMLEKLAPTWLAGMPALVKPASPTAYLTESVVRAMLDTGLVPDGALSLLCGSAGDLLDHVTGQDVVTFTGSAATGASLRAHPAMIAGSVRFTMEADSLNAAILGEDAGPDSPEFDLFAREVVREMTAKAGQKCTAIRRILVPADRIEAVANTLRERLAKIVLGVPSQEGVRMGPLAGLDQRRDVRDAIARLREGAEIVAGDPDHATIASGDAEHGAFLAPVLLHCARPFDSASVHEVEAFGPVATLMPYSGTEEAVDLARRGKGSLAASLFTDDERVARTVVLGMAPFHGRVLIGNRASAKSSTGHGSPLPMLVHGGPGRAGGGEELGGMRSVRHFMQRTAVQASPRLLSAVTGEWVEGAPAQEGVHPFRKSLRELRIGDRVSAGPRTVTQEDVEHFAAFTGDTFYAHMDEAAAAANPFFGARVAHGYLILAFAAGLFVQPDPGPVLANYGLDELRFLKPVPFGESLSVRLTCQAIDGRGDGPHGEVRWDVLVTNGAGEPVARYVLLTMVAKEWPPQA